MEQEKKKDTQCAYIYIYIYMHVSVYVGLYVYMNITHFFFISKINGCKIYEFKGSACRKKFYLTWTNR